MNRSERIIAAGDTGLSLTSFVPPSGFFISSPESIISYPDRCTSAIFPPRASVHQWWLYLGFATTPARHVLGSHARFPSSLKQRSAFSTRLHTTFPSVQSNSSEKKHKNTSFFTQLKCSSAGETRSCRPCGVFMQYKFMSSLRNKRRKFITLKISSVSLFQIIQRTFLVPHFNLNCEADQSHGSFTKI